MGRIYDHLLDVNITTVAYLLCIRPSPREVFPTNHRRQLEQDFLLLKWESVG